MNAEEPVAVFPTAAEEILKKSRLNASYNGFIAGKSVFNVAMNTSKSNKSIKQLYT